MCAALKDTELAPEALLSFENSGNIFFHELYVF